MPFFLMVFICCFHFSTFSQWEREKEIRRLIDENRDCEESLLKCYENGKQLIVEIEERDEELKSLVEYLKKIRQEKTEAPPTAEARRNTDAIVVTPSRDESSKKVLSDCETKTRQLNARVEDWRKRGEGFLKKIVALKEKLGAKDLEIEEKKALIAIQADSIFQLSADVRKTTDTLAQIKSVLACVQSFQEKKAQNKKNARQDINRANSAYEFYSNHLDKRLGLLEEGLDSLHFAWALYSQYGALSCDSTICHSFYTDKPMMLSYCEDYLGGYENYIVARIVAYNPEVITKSLEDQGIGDKINQLNEMLLSNVGQALKKGIYNVRSDSKKLVEELPEIMEQLSTLIIQERKDGLNTEVKNWIAQITEEYNKKNYAKAISIYNTYQRLFKIEDFQVGDYPQHILSAKYCAGTILLWNLGDISENEGLVHHSSWLGKSLKNREFSAVNLLNEIPTELSPLKGIKENWQLDLLRKTYISLGKRYE